MTELRHLEGREKVFVKAIADRLNDVISEIVEINKKIDNMNKKEEAINVQRI